MTKVRKVLKWIVWIVLGILALPLALVLLAVGFLLFLGFLLKEAVSLRMFRIREAGNVYLVCSSRRAWHDYLKNNLVPVLPAHVVVVWEKACGDRRSHTVLVNLRRSGVFCVSKPYLAAVSKRAIRVASLNSDLQHLKNCARVDDSVRQESAQIVEMKLEQLRSTPTAH